MSKPVPDSSYRSHMERECRVGGCERKVYSRELCEMHYRRVLRTGAPGPAGPVRERGLCEAPGCVKPVDAKGLCHGHYQREQRTGVRDLTPLREGAAMCSVEGCERPGKAKGYCAAHYKRVLVHGDPLADIPIRQAAGEGTVDHHGYRNVPVSLELRHLTGGSAWFAEHRLIMAKHLGRALKADEQVHHINGVRIDNRLENLELWSTSHPSGRRVEDVVEWCLVLLDRYVEDEWEEEVPG